MQETVMAEGQPLSQIQRFANAFIAPSKTFNDIRRSASWWFPVVITSILSCIFAYTVVNKVGLPTLVDGVIHANPSLEDRLTNSSPEDAAKIRASIQMQFKFMYVAPVFLIVIGLLVSAVFLATVNFALGGRATYGQILAVWFYGTLPLAFISILTIITVWAGMSTDSFNIKNTVGTNIGYYLQTGDSPRWLVTLLSSFDVFAIWSALLLSLGLSIVGGIKKSMATIAVFGWWALYTLIQTGITFATS